MGGFGPLSEGAGFCRRQKTGGVYSLRHGYRRATSLKEGGKAFISPFTEIDGLHKLLQIALWCPVDSQEFSTLSTAFSTGTHRKIPCKPQVHRGLVEFYPQLSTACGNCRLVYRTLFKAVSVPQTHGCDWRRFPLRSAWPPRSCTPRDSSPIAAPKSPLPGLRTGSSG